MSWQTRIQTLLDAANGGSNASLVDTAIREATSSPWAWPTQPEIADSLVAAGARRPPHRVGDVLLTACQRAEKGSLWWLSTRPDADRATVAMLPRATKAWADAAAAVERTLPLLVHPAPALADARVSRALGDANAAPVDGASYGVSMALAIASVRLGLPVPLGFSASATVDPDGSLGPVDGLPAKLAAIERDADPVHTFFVAKSQYEDLKPLAARVKVVGCKNVADVWAHVWPNLVEDTIERIANVPAAARRLLYHVLEGHYTTKTWRPVARCAVALGDRVDPADTATRGMLHYAASFSFRHAGAHAEARAWFNRVNRDAVDAVLTPASRRSIAAQRVQHAADTGESEAEQRTLLELVEPPLMTGLLHHLEIEQRKQLGAVGRLRHALGDYAEAIAASERATRSWLDAGDGHEREVSFPLSQWFVSAGAAGDRAAWERAEAAANQPVCANALDDTGGPFVLLARGRCALQFGETDVPCAHLVSARDAGGPVHVRLSALRWLARIEGTAGQAARDMLIAERALPKNKDRELFLALHELDAALGLVPGSEHGDADAALRALCDNPSETFAARVIARGGTAWDVAEGFPY